MEPMLEYPPTAGHVGHNGGPDATTRRTIARTPVSSGWGRVQSLTAEGDSRETLAFSHLSPGRRRSIPATQTSSGVHARTDRPGPVWWPGGPDAAYPAALDADRPADGRAGPAGGYPARLRLALLHIDSSRYLVGGLERHDPEGYRVRPLRPVLAAGNLALVATVQHLIGLAMAVSLYSS